MQALKMRRNEAIGGDKPMDQGWRSTALQSPSRLVFEPTTNLRSLVDSMLLKGVGLGVCFGAQVAVYSKLHHQGSLIVLYHKAFTEQ